GVAARRRRDAGAAADVAHAVDAALLADLGDQRVEGLHVLEREVAVESGIDEIAVDLYGVLADLVDCAGHLRVRLAGAISQDGSLPSERSRIRCPDVAAQLL